MLVGLDKLMLSSDLEELQELLLVHGTVNKRALSEAIFYSIYRNLLFALVQVMIACLCFQVKEM